MSGLEKLDPIIEAFFEKEYTNTEDWERDIHEPIVALRAEIQRLENELASVTYGEAAARREAAIAAPYEAAIAEYQVRLDSLQRVLAQAQARIAAYEQAIDKILPPRNEA